MRIEPDVNNTFVATFGTMPDAKPSLRKVKLVLCANSMATTPTGMTGFSL